MEDGEYTLTPTLLRVAVSRMLRTDVPGSRLLLCIFPESDVPPNLIHLRLASLIVSFSISAV